MIALVLTSLLLVAPGPQAETQECEVVRVVDGDTIHVELDGELEKLRLLCVDTEEKISGQLRGSASKPETVFGQETALWASELFADLAEPGERPRVGLRFPEGLRARDVYGRLLCHVILPDGRDFNLLLVELGKSPYFNKYGNSLLAHAEFQGAQARARSGKLGIWNAATNKPRNSSAPAALRPYGRLLPWWQARAEAIDGFRARLAESEEPGRVISGECAAGLLSAFVAGRDDPHLRVEVFVTIQRFYEERDGSLTVRFRDFNEERTHTCVSRTVSWGDLGKNVQVRRELRASLPAPQRGGPLEQSLRASTEEFRQNYLYVTGRITLGTRGFRLETDGPEAWRLASPDYP